MHLNVRMIAKSHILNHKSKISPMRKVVFDVETKNTFQEVGSGDPAALDISLLVVYDYHSNKYLTYKEEDFKDLWKLLENTDLIIGYNSDHFDLPLLNKYYPGDLKAIKSLDLLAEIKKSYGKRMSLDAVAAGTLGTSKIGHGLQAVTWWKEGKIDKIQKYCEEDVKITKQVYEYALKNGLLKYKEINKVYEFPIDTSKLSIGNS